MYRSGREKEDPRIARELSEVMVSPRCRVSRVMRLVDNYQIVSRARHESRVCAAKPLKGEEICLRLCGRKRVSPHRGERGWRNDQALRKPARDRCRNERLAHPDIVAEERTAKLFERCLRPGDGGLLMALQCDQTEARARLVFPEQDVSNSGAHDRR